MRPLFLSALLFAGVATAQAPAFEVASVKFHPGEINFSAGPFIRGSRVVGTALTLVDLIVGAYDVRYEQVTGAPAWASNDHYDVNAKPPGDAPPTEEQAKLMMRTLLADRFHLKLRRDSKELPVYALVVAKGGHKMTASTADAKGNNGVRGSADGKLRMEYTRGTMEGLARQLSHNAGRPVVDRTGLSGFWAFQFEFTPEKLTPEGAPSMFTLMQEQLGLKLEPSKAPFDLLVIEHAEKPTDN